MLPSSLGNNGRINEKVKIEIQFCNREFKMYIMNPSDFSVFLIVIYILKSSRINRRSVTIKNVNMYADIEVERRKTENLIETNVMEIESMKKLSSNGCKEGRQASGE